MKKEVILNDFNNLRWQIKIGAGETKVLEYQYSIEHPKDKEVSFA